VPPHIHCNESVRLGEIGVELPAPGKRTLGKAVDEDDRAALRVARLDEVELNVAASGNFMTLHHVLSADADDDEAS
jgi:hypothetical protein